MSSNGEYVVAGSYPIYTLYYFDNTGELLFDYPITVESAKISSDGQYIAAVGRGWDEDYEEGTVCVYFFGPGKIEPEPKLCTSPDPPTHDFGDACVPKPPWYFSITNCGDGELTWSVSDDRSWITVEPTSGSTTTETDTVAVMIDTQGLSYGTHTGHVTVTSDSGTKKGTITVNVPQGSAETPNLVIESISWDLSNPKEGDEIKITVRTKNIGDGDADAFYIYYYIDGDYEDYNYVSGGLDAGRARTNFFYWTADKCGDVEVKAWVDEDDDVDESNDWDNTKIRTVNVECPEPDSDDDSVPDNVDNCPNDYNPNQIDFDGDGDGNECDTEFEIGMFVKPWRHFITTEEGVREIGYSFEKGQYDELLGQLKENGVMRIFVDTYSPGEGKVPEHVLYMEKNGNFEYADYPLNNERKPYFDLNELLEKAHRLDIEVHANVNCFGPSVIDPKGVSELNQQKRLFEVCDYLLSNYKDSNGRGLDGIHLDYVRYVGPSLSADGDTETIASFVKDLNKIVERKAKLSASVKAADHESIIPHWPWTAGDYYDVRQDNGQDYNKWSEDLDFISPMAYHYSEDFNYNPIYVRDATEFANENVKANCDIIPDIQGFYAYKIGKIEYVIHEEPGANEISQALKSAKRGGAKGANIFRYTHLSDAEWWGIRNWEKTMTSASIKCPANLHAYDSLGRHVGVNALGNINFEIPDAYYSGPDSDPERIIIPDQTDDIIFKVEALDTGEFDFTLMQSTDTQTTTVTYLDVPISETTEATVDVSQANPTYTMKIDKYCDGTTIETKKPDSIETDGQDSYSIPLHTGWNLISLPIMPDDTDILDIMNSVTGNWNSVWSYETGNWKRYDLTGPDFLNDLSTIEPGKGYWLNMKSDDTLSVSGSELTTKAIPLSAGWNLVGYNSLSSKSTTSAMNSVTGNRNSVWSYEAGNWKRYDLTGPDFLNDLATMGPGKGYWIDMKSSDTWTLGGGLQ